MRPSTTPMGLRPRPEERVDARTPSVWTRIELQRSRLQTQQAKGLLDFRDAAEQPHLFPGAAARGTLLLPKPGAAPRRASAASRSASSFAQDAQAQGLGRRSSFRASQPKARRPGRASCGSGAGHSGCA